MKILKGKRSFQGSFMLSLRTTQHKKNLKLLKFEVKSDFYKRNLAKLKSKSTLNNSKIEF